MEYEGAGREYEGAGREHKGAEKEHGRAKGSKSTKWALAREQCGGATYLKLKDTIYIYIYIYVSASLERRLYRIFHPRTADG